MNAQLDRAFSRWPRVWACLLAIVPCVVLLALAGAALETVTKRLVRQSAATRGAVWMWPARGEGESLVAYAESLPGVVGTEAVLHAQVPCDGLQRAGWREMHVWAVRPSPGGEPFAPPIPGLHLAQGRYPERAEEALLGYELARVLNLAVGGTVWLGEQPFTVAGIWEPAGLAAGNWVQIPAQSASFLPQALELTTIRLLPAAAAPASLAGLQARLPDAVLLSPDVLWADERRLLQVLRGALAGLALLAGLAGGPAAVWPLRTLQGSRAQTAGAAAVLAGLGGSLGLILAWGATMALNAAAQRSYAVTPLMLTPRLAAGALLWPVFCGGLAGGLAQRGRAGALGRLWRYLLAGGAVAAGVCLALLAGALWESLDVALQRTQAVGVGQVAIGEGELPLSDSVLRRAAALPGFQGLLAEAYGGALRPEEDGWPGRPPSGVLYGLISPSGSTGSEVPFPVRLAQGRAPEALDEAIIGAGLARMHRLALGDSLDIRGRSFTVVGIRERFPYDSLSTVNHRADITLEALRYLSGNPAPAGRLTVLVPPASDPAQREEYLRGISGRVGGARATGTEEALAAVAAGFPGARTLTGQDPMDRARGLYLRSYLVMTLLALLAMGMAVANALYPVYYEQRAEIAVNKLLGAGPEDVLASYGWVALLIAVVGSLLGGYMAWAWAGTLNSVFRGSPAWPVLLVTPRLLALITLLTILAAMVAAMYPGLGAATVDPAAVLAAAGDED